MNFSYSNKTQIQFGENSISSIETLIPTDKKVLVIYGGGSIKSNGVYDQVSNALKNHVWLEFSGVESNPTIETLDKAVALARNENADFILAVGGGSVIDGSKYVAAAICYDGEGWDILTGKHQVTKAIPLGTILTLPATGSESNAAAVITKKSTQDKLAFMNPNVLPVFAVLDPNVIKTLPERQLINGIVDAFVHVCEQYLTIKTDSWVQEGYAEVLLRSLIRLAKDYQHRDSSKWRNNLMWTANQALNGLIGTGGPQDWATHMIGHELTAHYGVDHARTLALVQPSLLRNQIEVKKDKLEQMGANVFDLPESDTLALDTVDAIEALYNSLGVATHLKDANIDAVEAIPTILNSLEKHGAVALGEHQAITLKVTQAILESAA
ncbi:iron-containing alcohol dehydrogenase [Marinomonas sp. 15G1-11]|uniref:Iron-containing alcohol dehydrogenase n=1 Tax=Marinomonas phaeophyticola TaxID=3004091 RepID=A0ABT4JY28_9GAMM|nr:iron-containing alcohol dehydrogenase [Marinomonas sp. 15G1-11]MCZ2723136.1 iron-containing alcohol dehydrogenase [Marinomonas sp. 15G1-11]